MRDVTPGISRAVGRGALGCAGSVAGIITIVAVVYLLVSTLVSAFDPIERAHRDAEYYREERLADDLYNADLAAGWMWRLAPAAGGVIFFSGGAWVFLMIAWRQLASWQTIRLDREIRRIAAENQKFPDGLQSLSYHDSRRIEAATPAMLPEPEWSEEEDVGGSLPAFADLLAAGRIGAGQPLCLGIDADTGEGLWGDWKDLYSAGVGGKQGSGKTWTAASLIAQSMLSGCRIILADPHAGNDESLTTRLKPLLPFCELTATDDGPILEAARYANDEYQRRKKLDKEGKAYDRTPVLLVIDEWTSLLRGPAGGELPELLSGISTEGRKYLVNAMLLAQRWEAAAAGGSDVRNVLNSHYVHRCRGDEGRMQTGMRASSWSGDPITLQPGESFLFTAKGDVRKVVTPFMTPADLANVAARLMGGAPAIVQSAAQSIPRPIGFHVPPQRPGPGPEVGPEVGPVRATAVGRDKTALLTNDPEAARILAKFAAGATVHDLASEIAKTTNPGDRRYKAAREKVERILRDLAVEVAR